MMDYCSNGMYDPCPMFVAFFKARDTAVQVPFILYVC